MPGLTIPTPFLVIVDDVGWWCGRDGSRENQPFRTGMARDHVPDDYRALAALGEALDMRIPAGLVLCEWDKGNLLRQVPSATWMGSQWQTPFTNEAYKEEAAHILKAAAAWIEPALHGIGHEFWTGSRMDRSEFHTASGRMRDGDEVKTHLEYFFRLMAQNNLESEIRLFIPPALNHGFGWGENGFQHIAGAFGIRLVPLVFDRARCRIPPQFGDVGWECGVIAMERGESPVPWNAAAPVPKIGPEQMILPLHWANILHPDPRRNMAVVNGWIAAINDRIRQAGWMPARDMAQFLTQFLHKTRSKIRNRGNRVVVEMDWCRRVPGAALTDSIFFSVPSSARQGVEILGAERLPPASVREKAFIKVRLPESGKFSFKFK